MPSRFSPLYLPLAALIALAGCSQTIPAGSAPVAGSQPAAGSDQVVTPAPVVAGTPTVTPGTVVVPAGTVVTQQGTVVAPVGTVVVPQPLPTTTTVAVVPARLTRGEVATLLADNTVSGVAPNGETYYSWFAHDGRLRFREQNFRDSGSWRVLADGSLCSTLTKINANVEECYTLYREGTNIRFDRPDGNRIGSFTVLAGNPQNL